MKAEDNILTQAEIQELCRMYMDCELSVAEEAELEYVLSRSCITSPMIEEVRQVMGIERRVDLSPRPRTFFIHKLVNLRVGVAACLVLMIGLTFVFKGKQVSEITPLAQSEECIAYVAGEKIIGAEAEQLANADIAKMEQFMQTIDVKTAMEQAKVNDFINHNNIMK